MLGVITDVIGLNGSLTLTSCSGHIPKISFRGHKQMKVVLKRDDVYVPMTGESMRKHLKEWVAEQTVIPRGLWGKARQPEICLCR